MTNQTITVGTWVAFSSKGQEVVGTVLKVNPKTVLVDSGQPRKWKVSKQLLVTGQDEATARANLTALLSAIPEFRSGQLVEFTAKNGSVETGTVGRIDRKTAEVWSITGEGGWRVNIQLLRPAVPLTSAAIH